MRLISRSLFLLFLTTWTITSTTLTPLTSLRTTLARHIATTTQARSYHHNTQRRSLSNFPYHMAWYSSGKTNEELIRNMRKNGLVTSERVMQAMKKVDRANYVVDKREAYVDSPQSIGYGATISAPHMHAHASENLLPYLRPGSRVLDVGSGSGYTCAVFHHLVSSGEPREATAGEEKPKKGKVVGIDHISELVDWSAGNLKRDGLGEAMQNGEIEIVAGDGRQGHAEGGPYDAIHVGAAAPTLPQALVDQLGCPGRMFIPVGSYLQEILQVDKDESGQVTMKKILDVRYVPLTDKDAQYRQ